MCTCVCGDLYEWVWRHRRRRSSRRISRFRSISITILFPYILTYLLTTLLGRIICDYHICCMRPHRHVFWTFFFISLMAYIYLYIGLNNKCSWKDSPEICLCKGTIFYSLNIIDIHTYIHSYQILIILSSVSSQTRRTHWQREQCCTLQVWLGAHYKCYKKHRKRRDLPY